MNGKLIAAALTLWHVSGHAEIIIGDPLLELGLQQKKMESAIQDLSVINAELQALREKVDAAPDHIQSARWLHYQILPDVLKSLEQSE